MWCQSQQGISSGSTRTTIEPQHNALELARVYPAHNYGSLNAIYVSNTTISEKDLYGVFVVLVSWLGN